MASETKRREVAEKLTALVVARFGGDYRKAFEHFDADRDGAINMAELRALLADAGVGNGLTRWAWASGIMGELDTNHDGAIAWVEFENGVRSPSS